MLNDDVGTPPRLHQGKRTSLRVYDAFFFLFYILIIIYEVQNGNGNYDDTKGPLKGMRSSTKRYVFFFKSTNNYVLIDCVQLHIWPSHHDDNDEHPPLPTRHMTQ
jgi:hypothetical protein